MNIKGLKIALIGSSGLLTTYKKLEAALEKEGAIVTNLGVGGTSADQWLRNVVCFPGKDPDGCKEKMPRFNIKEELAKVGGKFDLVIGQLGANDGANASAGGNPNGVNAHLWPPKMLYVMSLFADKGFYIMPGAERGAPMPPSKKTGKRPTQHYTDANTRPYGLAMKEKVGNAAYDAYPISKRYIETVGDGYHFPANSEPANLLVAEIVQHILKNDPVVLTGMPKPSGAPAKQMLKDEPGSRATGSDDDDAGPGGSSVPLIAAAIAVLAFFMWRRGGRR